MAVIEIVKCWTCNQPIDFRKFISGKKYYWRGKGKAEHIHCPPKKESKND